MRTFSQTSKIVGFGGLRALFLPLAAALLLQPSGVEAIQTPVCAAELLRAEAKLYHCLAKAQAKAVKNGLDTLELDRVYKCNVAFQKKADRLVAKLGCTDDGDIDAAREQATLFYVDQTRELTANPCAILGDGACYLVGASGQSCDSACAAVSMSYDGFGTEELNQHQRCGLVASLLAGRAAQQAFCSVSAYPGCSASFGSLGFACTGSLPTGAAAAAGVHRYCACQ